MIDNSQIEKIINKLETLDDQALAVKLLKEFNDKSALLGKLLMNRDKKLDHEDWKQKCDLAQRDLDKLINKINGL